MVRAALLEAGVGESELSIVPLPINFPELYRYYLPKDAVFYLTVYDDWGRRKLELFRSAGLEAELLWERPPSQKGLSAGEIRRRMRRSEPWEQMVPEAVASLMVKWAIPERLRNVEEPVPDEIHRALK
jgi:nicotinamide-nucleotide adenylyltransferase